MLAATSPACTAPTGQSLQLLHVPSLISSARRQLDAHAVVLSVARWRSQRKYSRPATSCSAKYSTISSPD